MDNTNNNLPPVVQIVLPVTTVRNLLTLLEECSSTWSVDTETVTAIRREYTSEMIRHGIIRPSEVSVMTPDEDHSHEDTTQNEYDADNAWLRSAGWGEM